MKIQISLEDIAEQLLSQSKSKFLTEVIFSSQFSVYLKQDKSAIILISNLLFSGLDSSLKVP